MGDQNSNLQSSEDIKCQFRKLRRFLSMAHPFVSEGFQPSEDTFRYLHTEARVLVVGAGGLGCEILKCLTFSGFGLIDVIDMDTVEVSNLNRQFLFRPSDVGSPKASAAANFINRRFGHLGVKVTPHVGTIQEKPIDFFKEFNVIIAGLDNVDARRWLNSLLHSIVTRDATTGEVEMHSVIPLFDGGTEGLRGQSRTILPFMTSCFECSLGTLQPKTTYPLCTVAETPRIPEHCVEYVYVVEWPKHFPDKQADMDDPETIKWLTHRAQKRAAVHGIEGVDEKLVVGTIKRIVPAVASTNSLIAAMLVSEALKVSTYCAPVLNSYLMYMGGSGVYAYTFQYARTDGCLVCNKATSKLTVSKSILFSKLLEMLRTETTYQFQKPSISTQKGILFIQNPPALRKQFEYKLSMTLEELVKCGELSPNETLIITDPVLTNPLELILLFED